MIKEPLYYPVWFSRPCWDIKRIIIYLYKVISSETIIITNNP